MAIHTRKQWEKKKRTRKPWNKARNRKSQKDMGKTNTKMVLPMTIPIVKSYTKALDEDIVKFKIGLGLLKE